NGVAARLGRRLHVVEEALLRIDDYGATAVAREIHGLRLEILLDLKLLLFRAERAVESPGFRQELLRPAEKCAEQALRLRLLAAQLALVGEHGDLDWFFLLLLRHGRRAESQ